MKSPIFFGSSAAEFFCGMPTTAVAPVDDAITPIFNWATAGADASAMASASKCESRGSCQFPVRASRYAVLTEFDRTLANGRSARASRGTPPQTAPTAACRATPAQRRASRARAPRHPRVASTASVSELSPIFSTAERRTASVSPILLGRQEVAFDVRHRHAAPLLGVKAREVDAEPAVEPVLDQLVHQHEVLRIEHDARGIAVMEADQLVDFERERKHHRGFRIQAASSVGRFSDTRRRSARSPRARRRADPVRRVAAVGELDAARRRGDCALDAPHLLHRPVLVVLALDREHRTRDARQVFLDVPARGIPVRARCRFQPQNAESTSA